MIINMNGAKAPETPSSVLQEKTVTPETLPTVIGPDEGYDGLSQVTVNPDSQLKAENIRSGKTIFGVSGNFTGGGTIGVDWMSLSFDDKTGTNARIFGEHETVQMQCSFETISSTEFTNALNTISAGDGKYLSYYRDSGRGNQKVTVNFPTIPAMMQTFESGRFKEYHNGRVEYDISVRVLPYYGSSYTNVLTNYDVMDIEHITGAYVGSTMGDGRNNWFKFSVDIPEIPAHTSELVLSSYPSLDSITISGYTVLYFMIYEITLED